MHACSVQFGLTVARRQRLRKTSGPRSRQSALHVSLTSFKNESAGRPRTLHVGIPTKIGTRRRENSDPHEGHKLPSRGGMSWEAHCRWPHLFTPVQPAYLAIARSGSDFLHEVFRQNLPYPIAHDHGCRLSHLEMQGARRVLVPLRHPADRLASGVKNGIMKRKTWLTRLRSHGYLVGTPEPLYTRAVVDHMRHVNRTEPQNPFVRPTSWWLDGLQRGARSNVSFAFVCTCSLSTDVARVLQRWGVHPRIPPPTHNSSGQPAQAPLSGDALAWVEAVYAEDMVLLRRHRCGHEHCAQRAAP